MKFITAAVFVFLAASTQAWELTVTMNDGRHVTTHGTTNSGCVTYGFDMSSPVKTAVFSGSGLADTFELYEKASCAGSVSYREGGGSHSLTPARKIKSYKVY